MGKECHDFYVWVSLLPALASGLHFATGALFHKTSNVGLCGFLFQGLSSVTTYFIFRGSDDILKLFARCRFFEIYFIVPHYVGFFQSRLAIVLNSNDTTAKSIGIKLFRFLGIIGLPLVSSAIPLFENYFKSNIIEKKMI